MDAALVPPAGRPLSRISRAALECWLLAGFQPRCAGAAGGRSLSVWCTVALAWLTGGVAVPTWLRPETFTRSRSQQSRSTGRARPTGLPDARRSRKWGVPGCHASFWPAGRLSVPTPLPGRLRTWETRNGARGRGLTGGG